MLTYPLYPLARSLNRSHHFYVGPTNSGKTFEAIQALIAAKSGVYLAPLRLLAMEIRDRLMEVGVPCNLITGEERDLVDGAMHTASTIEMMNPSISVEVAVIDEIQMLQDPDRGSAWTAALLGVPASKVFVCGSTAVMDVCLKAVELLKEPYLITHCERLTPLMLEEESLCGSIYNKLKVRDQLRKGDAVIAFSRKDVLTLSARFRQWGFLVASIYGALSPEVRRRESSRFCNGQADVVVATDAIGMGLNLPIRRVIFASVSKFDGSTNRLLNETEVRQIAGRAGRFGIYKTGYVNVLEDHERFHIERMLAQDDTSSLSQLPLAFGLDDVIKTSSALRTTRLADCVEFLSNQKLSADSLFAATGSTSQLAQALLVDLHAPHLSLQKKFIFSCAPTAVNTNYEMTYFVECLKSVVAGATQKLPLPPFWLRALSMNQVRQVSAKHLEEAEVFSQNLSLYAWLSHQFSEIFVDGALVKNMRTQLSDYICAALQTQTGYLEITREFKSPSVWGRRRH